MLEKGIIPQNNPNSGLLRSQHFCWICLLILKFQDKFKGMCKKSIPSISPQVTWDSPERVAYIYIICIYFIYTYTHTHIYSTWTSKIVTLSPKSRVKNRPFNQWFILILELSWGPWALGPDSQMKHLQSFGKGIDLVWKWWWNLPIYSIKNMYWWLRW